MADWNQPTNASAYTGVLTTINEKLQSSAKMDFTGDTNIPTGAIRHDSTTSKWQEWSGSSWVDLNVHFGNSVGIGTTSPTAALSVIGSQTLGSTTTGSTYSLTINSGASNYSRFVRYSGANGIGEIRHQGTGAFQIVLEGAAVWKVDTNSVERLRVTDIGRVGIGETNPGYQLTLSTDSAAKPTTNTWTIASDERIKTNVQRYTKGLAEILQVRPITYDYNGKGGILPGPGGVSIIAQELQPVFPECVGSYQGKLNEEDEELSEILNYNGHAITFALINAIQELNAKVEALEAQLAGA